MKNQKDSLDSSTKKIVVVNSVYERKKFPSAISSIRSSNSEAEEKVNRSFAAHFSLGLVKRKSIAFVLQPFRKIEFQFFASETKLANRSVCVVHAQVCAAICSVYASECRRNQK